MEDLKKLDKDGEAGEDEVKAAEKDVDALTKKYTQSIDEMVTAKENDPDGDITSVYRLGIRRSW